MQTTRYKISYKDILYNMEYSQCFIVTGVALNMEYNF